MSNGFMHNKKFVSSVVNLVPLRNTNDIKMIMCGDTIIDGV